MVTWVRPFDSTVFVTRPTFTPEIRTSAVSASCVASSKLALTRYWFGASGDAPPNVFQMYSRIPKTDSVKTSITAIAPTLGARFCMSLGAPLRLLRLRERLAGRRRKRPGCGRAADRRLAERRERRIGGDHRGGGGAAHHH